MTVAMLGYPLVFTAVFAVARWDGDELTVVEHGSPVASRLGVALPCPNQLLASMATMTGVSSPAERRSASIRRC